MLRHRHRRHLSFSLPAIINILLALRVLGLHRSGYSSISKPINTIIVGGSSGMGKATAMSTIIRGGDALIVSRSRTKLDKAILDIESKVKEYSAGRTSSTSIGNIYTAVLDVQDEDAIQRFAEMELSSTARHNQWDALVFSAAGKAPHGPIIDLPTSQTRELFETKFWGAYNCAKYICPKLSDDGCVVFVSGVLNRRPGINCSPLASTNGALEGLTRALALELAPRLRVNCLSPGFCETERFDHMDPEKKVGMMKNTADSLPLQRVGKPEDMGEAIYSLLELSFVTGVILDCDGGHHIRQYANKSSDPMRHK